MLVAAGVLVMGFAVVGSLTDPDVAVGGVLLFLAGVLIVHDVLWMAVVLAVGAVLARFVPARYRTVVTAAVISAAALAVVALPLMVTP
ncbi:hypothetical protein Aco03nite_051530 [Actinoplanes couchii]|uniref:Uncharacterized protein n=1 Tax=Actinoplanes couchii TaxID=403638 RepID=A0ABQ3XE35_9ACTN|nr:hypothetical protein Aco03nite_051530 [Actinoplanes couchii]